MQLRRSTVADPTAFLPAADAVAKLGAAVMVAFVAFLSRDPVTPAILLAGVALVIPASGLRSRDLARLLGPLLIAASLLGVLNAVLAGTPAVAAAGDAPQQQIDAFHLRGKQVGERRHLEHQHHEVLLRDRGAQRRRIRLRAGTQHPERPRELEDASDRLPQLGVGREVVEHLRQLAVGGRVQGVQHVGAVEGDDRVLFLAEMQVCEDGRLLEALPCAEERINHDVADEANP